jgi:predicted transcriptional regulator
MIYPMKERMHPLMPTFKEVRLEAQLSLNKLARLADVDFRTVYNAETGKAIREVSAAKILSALSNQLGRKIKQKDITDLKLS